MDVTKYTILDLVIAPTTRTFYPGTALVFSGIVITLATVTSNLATVLLLLFFCIATVTVLLDNKLHRRTFLYISALCIVYSLVRVTLIASTTSVESSNFNLVEITFPSWLGSVSLGGPVDLDLVYSSALSMSIVSVVIIACCAFSFLISPSLIIHLVPKRMHRLIESTLIATNVLWRAPNEIRLINEAQSNFLNSSRFNTFRNIFPSLTSELVSQSCTHAGVVELKSSAIEKNRRWHKFQFRKYDLLLVYITLSILPTFIGVELVLG